MSRSKLFGGLAAGGLPLSAAVLLAAFAPAPSAAFAPGPAAVVGRVATGAAATPGATPALSATVEQCLTAASQSARSVTFVGQMETVAGAHELAIRIVVQERPPEAEAFRTLTTGGLGEWQHSEPGVSIYKVRQAVTNLPAPAVYRAIVHYRWLDEQGRVIRREVRRTPMCRQPLERRRS